MTISLRRSLLQQAGLCSLLLFGVASSCNSNFIPVPPPGNPTFEPIQIADVMGASRQVWQVSGSPNDAMKNARVSVFNLSLGLGVLVKASPTGGYTSGALEGTEGDKIELFYDSATSERSPSICRRLQAGVGATPCE